mgnify:CR=1 FL=1
MSLTLPTIHINGTSGRELREGYDTAADALHDFVDRWGAITFNARDYYVQDDAAFEKAREQREEIGRHIAAVREYLDAHREHLFECVSSHEALKATA